MAEWNQVQEWNRAQVPGEETGNLPGEIDHRQDAARDADLRQHPLMGDLAQCRGVAARGAGLIDECGGLNAARDRLQALAQRAKPFADTRYEFGIRP